MRAVSPAEGMAAKVLGMQQALGNQAVQQRASTCQAFPSACPTGGACHTCPARIQTKLAVNQPGDMYEQEADRVAESVMRMPGGKVSAGTMGSGSAESSAVPPIVHEVPRSPGQPLDPDTRAFVETRFGHNFSRSDVRWPAEKSSSCREERPVEMLAARANNESHDKLEREADLVAEKVIQMQDSPMRVVLRSGPPCEEISSRRGAAPIGQFLQRQVQEEKEDPLTRLRMILEQRTPFFLRFIEEEYPKLDPDEQKKFRQQLYQYIPPDETKLTTFTPEELEELDRQSMESFRKMSIKFVEELEKKQEPLILPKGLPVHRLEGHVEMLTSSELKPSAAEGRPLDLRTRSFMETRLGHDFSRVRIHTDDKAANAAQAVNALAYTAGPHIVFDKGQYRPETSEGKRLIAHELAHVVQQSSAQPLIGEQSGSIMPTSVIRAGFQTKLTISGPSDKNEQAADLVADLVTRTTRPLTAGGFASKASPVAFIPETSQAKLQRAPSFEDCSSSQEDTIRAAITQGQGWVSTALSELQGASGGTISLHLGTVLDRNFHTRASSDINKIIDGFDKINAALTDSITYECESERKYLCVMTGAEAYSFPFRRNVHFCPPFFSASSTVQAHALIHELAHKKARAGGEIYSYYSLYKNLTPRQAIYNADSYAMFAQEI